MVVSRRGHRSKSAGVGARGETGTTEATIATAAAAAATTAGYILCEAIVERRKEVHCCVIQLLVLKTKLSDLSFFVWLLSGDEGSRFFPVPSSTLTTPEASLAIAVNGFCDLF